MSTKTTIISSNIDAEDGTEGYVHIYHDYKYPDNPIRLELSIMTISIQATIDKDDLEQLVKFIDKPYDAKKLLGIE